MISRLNIRQKTEEKEESLSPYATKSKSSRGRIRFEEPCPIRTCFQRDRDRIVYSKSFRRLKHKTQVFIAPVDDHYVTRLTQGLFALEKMPGSADRAVLQRCFGELERLTSELLQIEKLEATGALERERFDAETLILQALSRTMAEEEQITLDIRDNFTLEGDRDYLSLALKNLIDNALKYATGYPVRISAAERSVCVENGGEPLTKEIGHYLHPFSREARGSGSEGFGLGLSIVTRVLERHGLRLAYRYEEGVHRFCIRF